MINQNTTAQAVFHKEYRKLTQHELDQIDHIKNTASSLYTQIKHVADHAENSEVVRQALIANERLEEAVMWAIKAITN